MTTAELQALVAPLFEKRPDLAPPRPQVIIGPDWYQEAWLTGWLVSRLPRGASFWPSGDEITTKPHVCEADKESIAVVVAIGDAHLAALVAYFMQEPKP